MIAHSQWALTAVVAVVTACSARDSANPVHPADAGSDAPGPSCGAGEVCDGGGPMLGTMRLLELTGSASFEGGAAAVKQLDATASFHVAAPHDYDDQQAGTGCTADHYDAANKPAPTDGDAGFQLRMSGFSGGTLLSGANAGQPIGCTRTSGYYGCSYPTGTRAPGAYFSATDDPLGPGPITFASNGGADFGPSSVTGSPLGVATTQEDLSTIHYSASTDAILHVSCSDACASGRIAVNLTARQASTADVGWPYASVGIVRCMFAPAASLSIPRAAIAAMFAADATLDTVVTAVALVPMAPPTTTDSNGNRLVAEVGRGTFGVAPR